MISDDRHKATSKGVWTYCLWTLLVEYVNEKMQPLSGCIEVVE
ncbi:hypothetical protein PAECIP111893_01540 [Paenibacillus plantiphilus]|uniref:Uncharacterized protein n=1 Tax=Paenibacillus plantiphilus TaxID=2905650 RepID=A0ABM9SFI8_9BACL|nr:hypothetical protein PAECIP111893_01540 [Paenibacillus plantiphilus]